jgi:predicted nucleotidyltransferase component of viral defense system
MNERVREWGLREDVVEKDYVIGWLLWGIGSNPAFSTSWAFKGGTCLKKCYLETYRFSEDLDFTVSSSAFMTRLVSTSGRERRLSVSVPMVTHPKAEYIIGGQETLLNWPA